MVDVSTDGNITKTVGKLSIVVVAMFAFVFVVMVPCTMFCVMHWASTVKPMASVIRLLSQQSIATAKFGFSSSRLIMRVCLGSSDQLIRL